MQVFEALADPTRRHIVKLLARRERSMGDIAKRFPLSPPAISQHLKVLRDARIVAVRVQAQKRIYRIHPAGMKALEKWVMDTRLFWLRRLDLLEKALGKKKKKRKRKGKRYAKKAQHRH